jgi:hypothetical protein
MGAVAAHGPFVAYTKKRFVRSAFEDSPLMAAGEQGQEPIVKTLDGCVFSVLVYGFDEVEKGEGRHVGDDEFPAEVKPDVAVLDALDETEGELGHFFEFSDGLLQFDELIAQVVGHMSNDRRNHPVWVQK